MFNTQNIHGPGDAIFAVMFVLAGLLVASYPIIRTIGWWIEGGAEPVLAIVSIGLYLGLILIGVTTTPAVAGLALLVIVASAIATPILGQVKDQSELKRIEDERYQQYARALEANPMDPVARMALAECLAKRGELCRAIEHMQWTLQQFPRLAFRIKPELDEWEREKARSETTPRIFCHECHAENLALATHCATCGAAFGTRAGVEQKVWVAGGPKVLMRGWIIASTALIVAIGIFLMLPIQYAAPLTFATAIVAAWLFVRWVGGDLGTIGD